MDIKVSPSMLSSDFANLEKEANAMKAAGADMIHIDVMDGVFVPNISIGVPVVECLRKKTDIMFDVHLMIVDPFKYVKQFAQAGADHITFHIESSSDVKKTIEKIKSYGVKVGLTIKPGTPCEELYPYLEMIDMVLIMTVEPGFGGQSFMPHMIKKVEKIRQRSPHLDIQVDGGINNETAKIAIKAGANVLVAGSYIFSASDPVEAIDKLKQCKNII